MFSISGLRLYFPVLEPWVARSVLLSSCSSWFILTQMRDLLLHQPLPRWVCQLPPCRDSSPSSCPSLPLLPVWMNVSSLSPWLLDFHTVRFCQFWLVFVFKLLLSFFWLCEEAQCVYLCLHLGWKSTNLIYFILKLKSSQWLRCWAQQPWSQPSRDVQGGQS